MSFRFRMKIRERKQALLLCLSLALLFLSPATIEAQRSKEGNILLHQSSTPSPSSTGNKTPQAQIQTVNAGDGGKPQSTGMPDEWVLNIVELIRTSWETVDKVEKSVGTQKYSPTRCVKRLRRAKDQMYQFRNAILSSMFPMSLQYSHQAVVMVTACADALGNLSALPTLSGGTWGGNSNNSNRTSANRVQRLSIRRMQRWGKNFQRQQNQIASQRFSRRTRGGQGGGRGRGQRKFKQYRRFTDLQMSAFLMIKSLRNAAVILSRAEEDVNAHLANTTTAAAAPAPGMQVPPPPAARGPLRRTFHFYNECNTTLWIGAQSNTQKGPVYDSTGSVSTGWIMEPGAEYYATTDGDWGGRFWGRTGCKGPLDDYGFFCETGDCGGTFQCNGKGGNPPATLAEFTLTMDVNAVDWYDVSAVDGYNVQLTIVPLTPDPNCKIVGCDRDLNTYCMKELQQLDSEGNVVGCFSACSAPSIPPGPMKDIYCCTNEYAENAPLCSSKHPTKYSALMKSACPSAYSYAYDDFNRSLYTCAALPDYDIRFCSSHTLTG